MQTLLVQPDAPTDLPVVELMGMEIAAVTEAETIAFVLDSVEMRRGGWVCSANLDILRQWHGSESIRELVADADLIIADGMPLIWAGELRDRGCPSASPVRR